jgi:hypothetical protein
MTEATTPFECHDDDQEGQGPSEAVAEVLTLTAELGFCASDFIELSLCSIAEVAAELSEDLEAAEECGPQQIATVAALERLQVASEILAGVDFGDGPEEGEEEGEAQAA